MAAKSLLIVQHLYWEGPGQHLLAALADGGITYEVAEAWHWWDRHLADAPSSKAGAYIKQVMPK